MLWGAPALEAWARVPRFEPDCGGDFVDGAAFARADGLALADAFFATLPAERFALPLGVGLALADAFFATLPAERFTLPLGVGLALTDAFFAALPFAERFALPLGVGLALADAFFAAFFAAFPFAERFALPLGVGLALADAFFAALPAAWPLDPAPWTRWLEVARLGAAVVRFAPCAVPVSVRDAVSFSVPLDEPARLAFLRVAEPLLLLRCRVVCCAPWCLLAPMSRYLLAESPQLRVRGSFAPSNTTRPA